MHDIPFIVFLAALLGMGFRRPFLFVLAYAYIDIVSPQRLTYMLLNSLPISMIAAGLAVVGWAVTDDKSGLRVTPRQGLLLVLLAYCAWTTAHADFPVDAQSKWEWVWKALAFAIFLPFTLRTRLRIEALLLFMTLSAASIIIVGGLKTAAGGGGYGELNLMIDNNSGLYEGSTISTVAVAIIPLIFWFTKHGTVFKPDWKVKLFAWALVGACCLIPVGTSTRTGLLCIGLLAILKLRDVKRPLLYIGAVAAIGLVAVPFLPSAFTERMGTIKNYQGDSSAATRVAVWNWTMDYVKTHPTGGGFEAYRGNHIRYEKVEASQIDSNSVSLKTTIETDQARAYHSAYFEMLGEQGYPGLALWLLINLGGLFRMEVLRRRYRKAEGDEAWIGPLASALQQGHIVYLLGGAFIAIAFQPFVFMLIGAQIGLDVYCARRRAAAAWRPLRKPRRQAVMTA
ncbi:MAG: putative O-glycosylation ligase, exosortase A system-associated [Sphingomonas sp.]